MATAVIALRSVELGVPDIEASLRFYRDVWGLEPVAEEKGVRYLRATGAEHHALVLRERQSPALLGMAFAVASNDAVNQLHNKALAGRRKVAEAPHELSAASGGGYGFTMVSPDGLALRISAGVMRHEDVTSDRSRPQCVTHIVINSARRDEEAAFYKDFFGFRLSDTTGAMQFLRCNSHHHSIAIAKGKDCSLNHIAFELQDIDGLMRGCGRVIHSGTAMEWGVGRHGPGDNIFAYFVDPDGFAIEYTTGMQLIDEAEYVPGTAEYWANFPMRPCRWGMARKASDRMKQAMSGLVGRALHEKETN